MNKEELVASLGRAGLLWCEAGAPSGALPVAAAWLAVSCRREDGRRDETVSKGDPRLIEKANAGWLRLAIRHGFMGDEREFLVGVDRAEKDATPILRWARVRLSKEWDIMGAGAASGVLGSMAGMPEFVMLSLGGDIIVRGTTWQDSIGSLMVPNPHLIPIFRDYVGRRNVNPRTAPRDRAEGEAWLRAHPVVRD